LSPTVELIEVDETLEGLTLELLGVGDLDANAQTIFLAETRNWYLDLYAERQRRLLQQQPLKNRHLQVVDDVINFDTTISLSDTVVSDTGNTVTYTQQVSYLAPATSGAATDAESVVLLPLTDETLLAEYVDLLQTSGDPALAELTGIDPDPSGGGGGGDDDDDDGLSGGAIGGIVAAGAVAFLAGAYLLVRANGTGGHERLDEGGDPPMTFAGAQSEDVSTMDQPPGTRSAGDAGSLLDVGDQR
jgi:hypothetical protein